MARPALSTTPLPAGRASAAGLRPANAVDGAQRNLCAARSTGWVGAADLAEINRLLAQAMELLHRPRSGKRIALS